MEEEFKYFVMTVDSYEELSLLCGTMKWSGDGLAVRRIRMFLYGHSGSEYVAQQYSGILEAIMGTIELAAGTTLDEQGTSLAGFAELEAGMISSPFWGLLR